MKETLRLDKYLCDMGVGTRSEVKKYLKKGQVTVNGTITKSPDVKIYLAKDKIQLEGKELKYQRYEYYMLNKPAGVVSATKDNVNQTVIELITTSDKRDLFPVGRLDKDTEGLLLITNDGALAHQLLSPSTKVKKTYYAKVKGQVNNKDVESFLKGIPLEKDFITSPGELKILESGEISHVKVTITEGKFHQIKRMFHYVSKEVIYLKRLSIGPLMLDKNLKNGEYRPLTKEEVLMLKNRIHKN